MTLTYQLYDKHWRNYVDLTAYDDCLDYAISCFPMIKLARVTPDDFTIKVNNSKIVSCGNRLTQKWCIE